MINSIIACVGFFLCAQQPVAATVPAPPARMEKPEKKKSIGIPIVHVDILIYNDCRYYREGEEVLNLWGEPIGKFQRTYHSYWFVFFDLIDKNKPITDRRNIIHRGWAHVDGSDLLPCGEGVSLIAECPTDRTLKAIIVAEKLYFIASPFDWDLRHRDRAKFLWNELSDRSAESP